MGNSEILQMIWEGMGRCVAGPTQHGLDGSAGPFRWTAIYTA